MRLIFTLLYAVLAFSVAYYILHPKQATQWLAAQHFILLIERCGNSAASGTMDRVTETGIKDGKFASGSGKTTAPPVLPHPNEGRAANCDSGRVPLFAPLGAALADLFLALTRSPNGSKQ